MSSVREPSPGSPRLPPAALELERALSRRREAVRWLVSLDGEDRWSSPGPERRAQMDAESAEQMAKRSDAERSLRSRAAELRERDPASLLAWIAAQEDLLDAYLAELSLDADPSRRRTERFVAKGERDGWGEVRDGKRDFVEQNGFYVQAPQALYRSLFGFDP
jgi:hypothetical protein